VSFEGKGGDGFGGKRKYRVDEIEDFGIGGIWGVLFFFIIQNPPNLGELKNCIGGGFWRVYMISSNPIYVIIIFLKLKLY